MNLRTNVTILKVLEPNRFLVRELPGIRRNKLLQQFLELQSKLKNFEAFDIVPQIQSYPPKGELIIVKSNVDQHWYRGRVEAILDTCQGPKINIFLLDEGRIITAKLDLIRIPNPSIFDVPFQAVEFVLNDLKPMSLIFNPDMTVTRLPADKWDTAAEEYVLSIIKDCPFGEIETSPSFNKQGPLCGKLFINVMGEEISLNDALISQKYACAITNQPERYSTSVLSRLNSPNLEEQIVQKEANPKKIV